MVKKEDKGISVGQVYRIECEISWAGAADDFAILTGEADAIEWGDVTFVSSSATVRDGKNIVTQVIEIRPEKPGDFETPELRIAYLRPKETTPSEDTSSRTTPNTRSAYPPLLVAPFTLHVDPGRVKPVAFGGILGAILLFCAAAGGLWYARTKRAPQPTATLQPLDTPDFATASAAIDSAAPLRLNGDLYGYYRALAKAAKALGSAGSDLATQLETRAGDIGYRGVQPTETDLDSDLRAINRIINGLKERVHS